VHLRNLCRSCALPRFSFGHGSLAVIEVARLKLGADRVVRSVQHNSGRHARRGDVASGLAEAPRRRIVVAKCIPGILGHLRAGRIAPASRAGIVCALQCRDSRENSDQTSRNFREIDRKAKAKRNSPALRHMHEMTSPPWNKPKPGRLAWQARRSPLLGRRTGAGRLYSTGGHRGGARLATFARARIRGFEEVLRARDGRA